MSFSTHETGRLDPRVRRTHQALVQALRDLLAEEAFPAITVQEITQRAGVNHATFYDHFEDKYALLDYNIRTGFRQEIAKRMAENQPYGIEQVRALMLVVCEFTRNVNARCRPSQGRFEAVIESPIKAVLYQVLLQWLEPGGAGAPAETVATAASCAIFGLASWWGHAKRPKPVSEFVAEVLPLVAAILNVAALA